MQKKKNEYWKYAVTLLIVIVIVAFIFLIKGFFNNDTEITNENNGIVIETQHTNTNINNSFIEIPYIEASYGVIGFGFLVLIFSIFWQITKGHYIGAGDI